MKRTIRGGLIVLIGLAASARFALAGTVALGTDETELAYSDMSGTRSQYVAAGGGGSTYTIAAAHVRNGPAAAKASHFRIRLGIYADGTAAQWDPDTVGTQRWNNELAATTLRVWIATTAQAVENSPYSGEKSIELNWNDPAVVKERVYYHTPQHREYVVTVPQPDFDLAPNQDVYVCVLAERSNFVLDFYAKHRPLRAGEFPDVRRTWYCGNPPSDPCGILPLENGGQKINAVAYVTVDSGPRLVISLINDGGEKCYRISWEPKMLDRTYCLQYKTSLESTNWVNCDIVDETACAILRRPIGPPRFYQLLLGGSVVCSGREPALTSP